jgi:hypothetical protein
MRLISSGQNDRLSKGDIGCTKNAILIHYKQITCVLIVPELFYAVNKKRFLFADFLEVFHNPDEITSGIFFCLRDTL